MSDAQPNPYEPEEVQLNPNDKWGVLHSEVQFHAAMDTAGVIADVIPDGPAGTTITPSAGAELYFKARAASVCSQSAAATCNFVCGNPAHCYSGCP